MFERSPIQRKVLAAGSVLMAGGLLLSGCSSKEEAPVSPPTAKSEYQDPSPTDSYSGERNWPSSVESISNKADQIINAANKLDTRKERQSYMVDYYCQIKEEFNDSKRGNIEGALGYYGLQQAAVITAYNELAHDGKVPKADIEMLADEQCDSQTISSRPVHQG